VVDDGHKPGIGMGNSVFAKRRAVGTQPGTMTTMAGVPGRLGLALSVVVAISTMRPAPAAACDWGYESLPSLFDQSRTSLLE
jgi:hypothetical protein